MTESEAGCLPGPAVSAGLNACRQLCECTCLLLLASGCGSFASLLCGMHCVVGRTLCSLSEMKCELRTGAAVCLCWGTQAAQVPHAAGAASTADVAYAACSRAKHICLAQAAALCMCCSCCWGWSISVPCQLLSLVRGLADAQQCIARTT
jgi:hypothetical protein